MRIAILVFSIVSVLRAEDAPAPNPELDAAKARIELLEQALDAMANKSQACFTLYGADMKLADLLPKVKQAQADAQSKKSQEKK